jgi:hypothetical protein
VRRKTIPFFFFLKVVLLQQKPVFYRSLHDVLLGPRAGTLRSRINADQLSGLMVASLLTDMSSCRPSSVFLYYLDDSLGVEIGAECLETAMQPFSTVMERGEEAACVCNILWMMTEEMSRVVSANVRTLWLELDVEDVTLRLLEKVSSLNDQMFELFLPSELCSNGVVVPVLLRTGWATNLLNKATAIQNALRQSDSVTHLDLFRIVSPELASLYANASARAKGSVVDTWRLLSRRSHMVNLDGVSLPDSRADLRERALSVFGEDVLGTSVMTDRVRLRKAVEREQAAVKLVAEVLKQL